MYRAKTVFVVGAGASAEVGLPIGTGLLTQICKLIDIKFEHFNNQTTGDQLVAKALEDVFDLRVSNKEYNEHLEVGWKLLKSAKQALSIDFLVDALEDPRAELIAKLGIARAIHIAEKESRNFKPIREHSNEFDLSNFDKTWYSAFTKSLCEGIRASEVDRIFDNVSIVCFNYDRCLENYLPASISNYYSIGLDQARRLVSQLKIHRPYGKVGKLEWEVGDIVPVPFGGGTAKDLVSSAKCIRTFTEKSLDPNIQLEIKKDVDAADRIVFLGFAFHRQNLEYLRANCKSDLQVLATVKGLSPSDQEIVAQEVVEILGVSDSSNVKVGLAEDFCSTFFSDYFRTLTGPKSKKNEFSYDGAI